MAIWISWVANSPLLESAGDGAILSQLKLSRSTADFLQVQGAEREHLSWILCPDTRDSYGPAGSPGKMKNIPSAFPWVCLYLLVPPGNPLIAAVSLSGDHLSDSTSSGGVIGFVMKVCSIPPGSDFNPASWLSHFGSSFL